MIEKVRTLTTCVSPGGGGHVVLWKSMKKHTGINAEYYMNDRKDQNTYPLCFIVQEVEDMLYYGKVYQVLIQSTT